MQKAKPPVSAWIARERKAHGWKVAELSRRLTDMGYEAQPSTIGVWEAGRAPRAETIEALERLFGSLAPREEDYAGDSQAVLLAIEKQTQWLERQWTATTSLMEHLDKQNEHLGELVKVLQASQGGDVQRAEAFVDILSRMTERLVRIEAEVVSHDPAHPRHREEPVGNGGRR